MQTSYTIDLWASDPKRHYDKLMATARNSQQERELVVKSIVHYLKYPYNIPTFERIFLEIRGMDNGVFYTRHLNGALGDPRRRETAKKMIKLIGPEFMPHLLPALLNPAHRSAAQEIFIHFAKEYDEVEVARQVIRHARLVSEIGFESPIDNWSYIENLYPILLRCVYKSMGRQTDAQAIDITEELFGMLDAPMMTDIAFQLIKNAVYFSGDWENRFDSTGKLKTEHIFRHPEWLKCVETQFARCLNDPLKSHYAVFIAGELFWSSGKAKYFSQALSNRMTCGAALYHILRSIKNAEKPRYTPAECREFVNEKILTKGEAEMITETLTIPLYEIAREFISRLKELHENHNQREVAGKWGAANWTREMELRAIMAILCKIEKKLLECGFDFEDRVAHRMLCDESAWVRISGKRAIALLIAELDNPQMVSFMKEVANHFDNPHYGGHLVDAFTGPVCYGRLMFLFKMAARAENPEGGDIIPPARITSSDISRQVTEEHMIANPDVTEVKGILEKGRANEFCRVLIGMLADDLRASWAADRLVELGDTAITAMWQYESTEADTIRKWVEREPELGHRNNWKEKQNVIGLLQIKCLDDLEALSDLEKIDNYDRKYIFDSIYNRITKPGGISRLGTVGGDFRRNAAPQPKQGNGGGAKSNLLFH